MNRTLSLSAIGFILLLFSWLSFSAADVLRHTASQLGPWPDAYDYAYGAQSLTHGTYDITIDDGRSVNELQGNGNPAHLGSQVFNTRKSYYTPGTSILMIPFFLVGGIMATPYLDYCSAIVIGILVAYFTWKYIVYWLSPAAVMVTLFTPSYVALSTMSMSDLPSTAVTLLELFCLTINRRITILLSGILAGFLVWIRPSLLILAPVPIVLFVVLYRSEYKLLLTRYLSTLLPTLAVLGIWQYVYLGSPIETGYQINTATPDHSGSFINTADPSGDSGPLFSLYYLTHHAWHTDMTLIGGMSFDLSGLDRNDPKIPNLPAYLIEITGIPDAHDFLPGIGALGLVTFILILWDFGKHESVRSTPIVSIALFSVLTLTLLLFVYSFYFYRSGRFILPITPLLSFGAMYGVHRIVRLFRPA